MNTLECVCTTFAISGTLFVFTLWEADMYSPLIAYPHTQMLCPDLQIRHSVASNLNTGIRVVDACSSELNVTKFEEE